MHFCQIAAHCLVTYVSGFCTLHYSSIKVISSVKKLLHSLYDTKLRCRHAADSRTSLATVRSGSKGEAISPPKIYESNFFHHDFVQFGKQHSRYKAIFPSIVLSQQCCEVYFICLTVSDLVLRLDCQVLLKSPPLNLLGGSAPWQQSYNCFCFRGS